ncbi:MAG TPA: glycosyltransferase [Chloroflexota bacterium]|nr:glycosyltransferase [Chloroflexota bacterium]
MRVAITMIVKNEERVLARCLESIAGAVDEIVVVDTGSTDRTREIAARFTDKVFDFPWRADFAAARQFAFDRATAEWVGWLDADDIVIGAETIRPELAAVAANVGSVYWRYVVGRDPHGNITCEYWRERCVRNNGASRWVGRIHEVLVTDQPWASARAMGVQVEHHPELERGEEKLQRNIDLLEAELEASSPTPEPRTLYYLARDYASAGNLKMAFTHVQHYLRIATWLDEKYLAQNLLSSLYRREKRYHAALDSDFDALRILPTWPDAYFGLAETYYYLQEWPKVVHWAEMGRGLPVPETLAILNPMTYSHAWLIHYTNALFQVGRVRDALLWTRKALEIRPDDPWHLHNEQFFSGMVTQPRP